MQVSDTFFLLLSNTRLAYRLYENPEASSDRCALLLHGAGVAGEITYGPMVPFLTQWRWMLVPDLKGMGESYHASEQPSVNDQSVNNQSANHQEAATNIRELTHDIEALLEHLEWQDFDTVAYSLGGLVALNLNHLRKEQGKMSSKMALLEPASLDREDLSILKTVRQKYRQATSIIRESGDVEQGVSIFMDGVSPNRRKHPVTEATTQSRLAHRPYGFSYALDAVTDHIELMAESPSIRQALVDASPEVFLFSGGLSHDLLRDHYDVLARTQIDWQHQVMSGCDHSLPFQKPRQIAKHINKWFARD